MSAPKLDLSGIKITPLRSDECLAKFKCGESEIDKWVKTKCHKHHKQRRTRVFCAYNNPKVAVGFYALGLRPESDETVEEDGQSFPNSGLIPLIYIEYLGVRRELQGNGIGKMLFGDALRRAYEVAQNVAVYGIALRSLNEKTTAFYGDRGFAKKDAELHPLMIMPIWTLVDLIEKPRKGAAPEPVTLPPAFIQ